MEASRRAVGHVVGWDLVLFNNQPPNHLKSPKIIQSKLPLSLKCLNVCMRCRLSNSKLPAFVRMIITSRPEGKDVFKDCKPREIQQKQEHNLEDINVLLSERLEEYDFVPTELKPAVDIIQRKAKVGLVLGL
jgi:hypothetical protein